MLTIRDAVPEDFTEISVLLVSAFDQTTESELVRALRDNDDIAFELVAIEDGEIHGHVCLSRMGTPDGWLTLAPLAVRVQNQNKGIGRELVRFALDRARQQSEQAVVVVGDPAYYGRLGFVFGGPAHLESPYPAQYTGLYPISPKAASARATLTYPDPFKGL